MPRKPSSHQLAARERQIVDVVFRLGEASVGEVREQLSDPPSYSAVRTMIRHLETKGYLKHRVEGLKYIYRPTQSIETASKSAVVHVLRTFFRGSATDALAAILDVTSDQLTDDELARMKRLVEQARKDEQKARRSP
jgi:predicted transcriptional regulator